MDVVAYELILTVKARQGGATTKPLLPELVVRSEDQLLPILVDVLLLFGEQEALADLSVEGILSLADKVEQDVKNKKYKWELHGSVK